MTSDTPELPDPELPPEPAPGFDPGLAAIYDGLWEQGRHALLGGRIEREPMPLPGTVRWGISAVLRPRPWPSALVACAAAVAARVGNAGVMYDEAGLHITLRAIEGFRNVVRPDDEDLLAYRDVLTEIVARTAPIRLHLRGLTATPGGILVQGWPTVDLRAFRLALFDRLAVLGLRWRGPETSSNAIRTTAHATLAIFEAPVARPTGLVDLIESHRSTDFGEWVFPELWLVGYRRTAGRVALVEYGRFAFGADDQPREVGR